MAEDDGVRSRAGREVWSKRVERWRESGLRTAEFAAELGINPRSLTYWKWRLGKEARGERVLTAKAGKPRRIAAPSGGASPQPSGFIEVRASVSAARIEVELRGGRRIHVPDSFDAEALRKLLAVLESP